MTRADYTFTRAVQLSPISTDLPLLLPPLLASVTCSLIRSDRKKRTLQALIRIRYVTKMNDADVSKQIQQMVRFIRQEAEEKANEISVSAEEEFNIEKLQLVEAEKKKIRQEYERKEKQVEIRKKM
ncbi:hypothetical protein MRB53_030180 [Persea americana]|uniref:Uncharacterized protein n=1 Tax=Persea americana TaxID=3435 RepID=A0ACC2KKV5_PERAE|nr:hypothetical protein MRB53_030180 [Persea americana]